MDKFVKFLTSDIGDSGMKMWILLVAIIVVIVIVGVVVGVVWSKKDKKKKTVKESKNTKLTQSDEPAITAPPSMQQINDNAETKEPIVNAVEDKENKSVEAKADAVTAEKKVEAADDELVSAKPPVAAAINDKEAKAEKKIENEKPEACENKPYEAKEKDEKREDKTEAAEIKEPKVSEPIKEVKISEPQKEIEQKETTAAEPAKPVIKESEVRTDTAKAEAAADKAPAAKPIAKKVVAKKIAPAPQPKADNDGAQTTEPKKTKVVGIDALPKKIKNTIKLEEVKTVLETPTNGESFGKYIIFKDERANPNKPFKFALRANNGQLLFESEPYKVKPREASIQAFKKHVQIGDFIVDEDKFGFFRYKLYTDAGKLLGVGESYKSRSSCESSIESVRRFSISATLIEDTTLEEESEKQ